MRRSWMAAFAALAVFVCLSTPLFAEDEKPKDGKEAADSAKDFEPYVDCRDAKDAAGNPVVDFDCRGAFEASYYLGGAADNFAGDETVNYLNRDVDKQGRTTTRVVTGFDFGYRLFGNRKKLVDPDSFKPTGFLDRFSSSQLWVYGETLHGVRSKEVNCGVKGEENEAMNSAACQGRDLDPKMGTKEVVAIIKSATSLETFVGLRWEFLPLGRLLQQDEGDRARMYLKAQYGAISVRGGGDSADQALYAVGALAVSGPLEGSYFEVGLGRNDLFHSHRGRRIKVDGYLSAHPKYVPLLHLVIPDARVRPFAQLTADFDGGRGSDSFQTYFGFDFILTRK